MSRALKEKHSYTCVTCKKEGKTTAKNKKYCSKECSRKWLGRDAYIEGISSSPLSSATLGASQELRVCVDLLLKGYEIFRAVSPACSCDIIVLKEKKLIKIEVRNEYKALVSSSCCWSRFRQKRFWYFNKRLCG